MASEQHPKKSVYSGVQYQYGKWRAAFRYGKQMYSLGTYEDERHAAYAADLAKYLCRGLNTSKWNYNSKSTNFGLIEMLDFPRALFIGYLARLNLMTVQELRQRLDAFDECLKNRQIMPTK